MMESIRLQESFELLESGLRELELDLAEEERQAPVSQSFAGTRQSFNLPGYEKSDDDAENLCWESLEAGFWAGTAHCDSIKENEGILNE
jgi:hypothetical protein